MSSSAEKDDEGITDSDIIYRRIASKHTKRNKATGAIERVGSNAFDDSKDGSPCSVHLHSALLAHRLPPESILRGHEGWGIASLRVGDARALGFGIVRDSVPDWPAHCLLTGDKQDVKKQKSLARSAKVYRSPRTDT